MDTIETVADVVRRLAADALKISPESVDFDKSIMNLGMYSMEAILMFTKLARTFDLKVSLSELFKSETLSSLVLKIEGIRGQRL